MHIIIISLFYFFSSLEKIIVQGYKALQLIYFFTAGPDEVKAWTIQVWMNLAKSSEFKMTHQATANIGAHYLTHGVHCSAFFCFFGRTDVVTDTTHENNDHLFGYGPVGQYTVYYEVRFYSIEKHESSASCWSYPHRLRERIHNGRGDEIRRLQSRRFRSCSKGTFDQILIHTADPQARPVGIIVFAHIFSFCWYVHPSPLFKIKRKQMFDTVGLAKWIIDDTCLVIKYFLFFWPVWFKFDRLILGCR